MLLDRLLPRRSGARAKVRELAQSFRLPAARHLRAHWTRLSAADADHLGRYVVENYYHPREYWETPAGRADYTSHLEGRLAGIRRAHLPWLDANIRLKGARVLEIGCGTGASTVALAEQGASVLAVDIDGPSVTVARERCRLYGLDVEFLQADASEALAQDLSKFDIVIFWAVLEHMTHEERLTAIREAWTRLSPGALLCVISTPNRLWYFDNHTSNLTFFHWLPDEIARRYTGRCDRALIQDIHALPVAEGALSLTRWGRGVSFHDFELALEGLPPLRIIANFSAYERVHFLPKLLKWHLSIDRVYNRLLRKLSPGVHPAFSESYLDFIARKDG
jgi:2-polyprenyl-3-methyl-5-hydroxy-6-metoxy-1,4-benzoquinol methylase